MKKFFLFLLIFGSFNNFSKAQSSTCPDDLIPKRFMSNGKMGFVDLFDNWKINPKYFEVSPFEGRFAKVRFGNTYGMVNCEGKEVVPPEFDELSFFSFGRIWAKNAKGWFLWDSSGTQLTETAFDDFKRASIWHSYAWVLSDGKWKILNEQDGHLICEKEFTTIKLLSDTLSLVSNDSYFGIINHKNCNFKIPESIVHAQKVSSKFIKLRFRDKKYDIINLEGESILQEPYDEIESAGNGLAKVKSNNKWGLITPSGKEILPIEYDSIKSYHHGRLALKKEGKWFYINEKLYPINDSLYDIASDYISKGAFVKKDNYWALINHDGELIYSDLDSIVYNKGLLFAQKDSRWKLLPNTMDSESFEQINFSDDTEKSRVMQNGKWGIYDFINLKWHIASTYSEISFISEEKLLVKKNSNSGLIDINGNVILPISFSMMNWQAGFRNNLFIVRANNYQLINEKGKAILESNFPIRRQGSLFLLEDEKKKYLYEYDGDLIFEDKVDSILVLNGSDYFAIKAKDKWGLMDVKGNELLDTDFDELRVLSDKYIALKTDENWEIFKQDGKKLIGEDQNIIDLKEVLNNSFIVKTAEQMLWIDNNSKVLAKGIEEYVILNTGQIAIKYKSHWELRSDEGKKISDMKFESIDKKNGSVLLRSNSKLYQVNTSNKLNIYLPFD